MCLKKDSRCAKNNFTKIFVQGKVETMIKTFFEYNNASDQHLPNGICGSCLRNIYRAKGGDGTVRLPDLSQFKVMPSTRLRIMLLCECTICEMARGNSIKGKTINK